MKNIDTNPQHNGANEQADNYDYLPYLGTILAIILVSFSLLAAHAQNGKLKVKGNIINTKEADQSLVTLFQVSEDGESLTAVGQYIVTGNDWFKAELDMDKQYMLEIASTNGLTRRYSFDMNTPEHAENGRYKMQLEFDMDYAGNNWPVLSSGEIAYSNTNEDFYYSNWAEDNSIVSSPTK